MSKINDLTQGKVSRVFLGFFFPMLFSNLLQQFYTFADTVIVGKGLGDNALAAVGNLSALTLLIIGFAQGMTGGFGVIVAQSFGSGDGNIMRKTIAMSIKLSLILSIVLTAGSVLFLEKILLRMRTDGVILQDSLGYGMILFGGLVVTVAYILCSAILRALGDSKTPFWAIMISSVVNILLDYVFIFGLKTGVEGAAVATVAAQLVSVLVCVVRLGKSEEMKLTRGAFSKDVVLSRSLLKNGIPMACMNSVTAAGCMLVQTYVNARGVVYTSAYSACNKYVNLFLLPAVTAGFAVSAFTGQNYGAKKYHRIGQGVRIGLWIGVVSYLILGVGMMVFPKMLAKVLLTGQETIALTAVFLRICGSMFFLLNFLFVFRSAVQGMGKPLIPMCSGLLEMLLRVLVIVFFLPKIGFLATAYAEVIAWAGALLLNFVTYFVLRRERN